MLELLWVVLLLLGSPNTVSSVPTNPRGVTVLQAESPLINNEYEISGFFDKDAQGWCSMRLSIETNVQGAVHIREWFDENGIIRADKTYTGHVTAVDAQHIQIQLQTPATSSHFYISPTGICYYDRQQHFLWPSDPTAQTAPPARPKE